MPVHTPEKQRARERGGGGEGRAGGFALRFAEGKAYIVLQGVPLWGVGKVDDLSLEVTGIRFPFDVTGGAEQFQNRLLSFHRLQATLDEEALSRTVSARLPRAGPVVVEEIALRAGFAEVAGTLAGEGAPVPFTFKVGLEPEGDAAARAVAFDARTYAPSTIAAPLVPEMIARAAELAAPTGTSEGPRSGWSVSPEGGAALRVDLLRAALRSLLPPRGFKLPDLTDARLRGASFTPGRLSLRFGASSAPVEWPAPRELLTAVEGARVFAEAERRLSQGDLAGAREAYRKAGDPVPGHAFAAERLLAVLLADPAWRDEALDLAQAILARDPESAAARWAESMVRLWRGEERRAAARLLELAELGRERGELLGALRAAHAAGAAAEGVDPAIAARAHELALAIRPSDVQSLRALAGLYPLLGDTAGAIRVNRRLAAHAEDVREKAAAQARLGHLYAGPGADLARARLHYDAALRLAPDDFSALAGLAQACEKSGEHLRAVRCLDRLRALALKQGNVGAAASAARGAGRLWEERLGHAENALLAYREAASLDPDDQEGLFRLARAADRAGHWEEALDAFSAFCERAGPAPAGATRARARDARVALARIRREKLGDADAAARELTLALELEPDNLPALWELARLHRAAGRRADLVAVLLSAAELSQDPGERAAALSEAGLALIELGRPDEAESRLRAAVAQAPENVEVWRALAGLARARGDGPALCEALSRLADLSPPGPDRLKALWALAEAARDEARDLDRAVRALERVRDLAPADPTTLAALADLHRRRGDHPALAETLAGLADAAASRGDAPAAAAALRERADALERAGDLAEAARTIARARNLAPRDPAVLAAAAHLAFAAGDHAEAASAYRALLDAGVDLDAEGGRGRALFLLKRLAQSAAAAGDADLAAEATAWALGLDPADAALAAALDDTLARRPRDRALLRLSRAGALAAAGERGRAAALAAEAAELFETVGDLAQAVEAWETAERADPDGPYARAAPQKLATLKLAAGDSFGAAEALVRGARQLGAREAARALVRAAAIYAQALRPSPVAGEADPVPARARAALEAAAQRDPSFAPARVQLGRLLLSEGHPREGARELAAAAAVPPGDPDAPDATTRARLWRDAAEAARLGGDLHDARAWLDRHLALVPHDASALDHAAELAEAAGDLAAAAAYLERRLELAPAGEQTPFLRRLAELWTRQGAEETSEGRGAGPSFDRALAAWKRVLELEPGDLAALRGARGLLGMKGDDANLVPVLAELAERTPPAEAAGLWMERAAALERLGDLRAAAASCARAVALAPSAADWLDRWAQLCELAGDKAGVAEALSRRAELAAARAEPGAGAIWAALARALAALDRADRAPAQNDEASSFAQRWADPTWAPGLRSSVLHAWSQALELGVEGLDRREGLQAVAHLAAERDPALAVRALAELAPLCPPAERAALLLDRARLCKERLGDLAAARLSLEEALAAAPQHPAALAALEEVCEALGDFAGVAAAVSAQAGAARAAERTAEAVERYEKLARIAEEQLADRSRAIEAWRAARALDPRRPATLEALVRLLESAGEHLEAAALAAERARLEVRGPAAARRLLDAARLALDHAGDPGSGPGRAARAFALASAREAAERDPESLSALQLLAELIPAEVEAAEALLVHRKLFARLSATGDKAGAARAAERLASLALAAGAPGDAAQALRAAMNMAPSPDLAHRLFEVERSAGRLVGAAEELADYARNLPVSATRSELFRLAAESALEGRAHDLAADLFAAAAAGAPDPAAVETARIGTLEAAGKHAELAELLAARAARTRSAEDWLRAAALLRDRLHDLSRASAALSAAVDAGGGATALRQLADTELARGVPSSAARALARLVEVLPEGKPRAAAHHERGALLLEKLHDESAAEEAFRAALAQDPRHAASRAALESILEHQERWADLAVSLRDRAEIEESGEAAAALLHRAGELWRAAGAMEQAEAAFRAALQRDPAQLRAAAALESLLENAGRWHELAAVIASRAEHESAEEAAAALQRAGELLKDRAGDVEAAERAFSQALAIDPSAAVARQALEAIYSETGRWKELAESLTTRAVAKDGAEAADLLMQVGDILRGRVRDAMAAEAAYRAALQKEPGDTQAREALESLLSESGRWPELAELVAERAARIEDGLAAAEVLVAAARILSQRAGDPTGAEALLRRALERAPASREASDALLTLLATPGREAALVGELERAARHRPPPEAAELLVRAASLRRAAGALDEAERDLVLALQQRPDVPTAREALESLFEAQERYGDLCASYSARAASATGAQAARWRLAAARVLVDRMGDLIGAEAEYRAALAADPGCGAGPELAALLWKMGNAREAAELELAAFAADAGNAEAFHALVSRLQAAGLREAQARASEARARAHTGEGAAALYAAAAEAWMEASDEAPEGSEAGAARCMRAAFALDPAHDRAFAWVLARADLEGDLEGADRALARRAEALPEQAGSLHSIRGQRLAAAGKVEEARRAYADALEADPAEVAALIGLAELAESDAAALPYDERLLARAREGAAIEPAALAAAHYRRGLAAHAAGELDLADAELAEALAMASDHPRAEAARAARAEIAAQRGDPGPLVDRLLAAATRAAGEDRLDLLDRAAAACARAGDPPAALPVLEALAEARPTDASIAERLAAVLSRSGRPADHAAALERAARTATDPARGAALWLELAGVRAGPLSDPAGASAARLAAFRAAPEDPVVVRAALPDLRATGRDDDLAAALERLAEWPELARLRDARGDHTGAETAWRKALEASPSLEVRREALARLAAGAEKRGELREAAAHKEALASAADSTEEEVTLLQAAAALWTRAGEVEAAARVLERAVDRDPALATARLELVETLASAERFAEAAAAAAEAAERAGPQERPGLWLRCSDLRARAGDFVGAVQAARKAVEARPGDREVLAALHGHALAAGDQAARLDAVTGLLALERDPARQIELARERAQLLASTGRTAEAAEIWLQIFDLDPGDGGAFSFLEDYLTRVRAWLQLAELCELRDQALAASHAAESRAERSRLRLVRARALAEGGETSLLLPAWRAVLELDPRQPDAVQALLTTALGEQDPEPSAAALAGAAQVETDPATAARLWLRVGKLRLERLGDSAGAVEALQRARGQALVHEAAQGPGEPGPAGRAPLTLEVTLELAAALDAMGRSAEALAAWNESFSALGPQMHVRAASAAIAVGDLESGRAHVEAALAAAPDFLPAVERQVELALAAGNPRAVAQSLRTLAALHPPGRGAAGLLLQAAEAYRAAGDLQAEEAAAREALEMEPRLLAAYVRLKAILSERSDHEGLAALLRQRARKADAAHERAAALAELGDLFARTVGDLERAAEAYERAAAVDPAHPGVWEALAQTLWALGRHDAAEPALRHLAERPTAEVSTLLRLAELLAARGQSAEAHDLLVRATRARPALVEAWRGRVEAARAQKRTDLEEEALVGLARALELDRDPQGAARVWHELGELRAAAGRADEAVFALEMAVRADPRHAPALRALAEQRRRRADWDGYCVGLVSLAELAEDPAERAALLYKASEVALDRLADPEAAVRHVEAAVAARPGWVPALSRLIELHAKAGRGPALIEAAERLVLSSGEDAVPARALASLGRAYAQRGRAGDRERAFEWLMRAHQAEVADRSLGHEVAALAAEIGRWSDYVNLAEELVDAEAAGLPKAELAVRYRAVAEVAQHKLGDLARASALLEKAVETSPGDVAARRALCAVYAARPQTANLAAAGYAQLARQRVDSAAVRALAGLRTGDDPPRGGLLQGLADWLEGGEKLGFAPPPRLQGANVESVLDALSEGPTQSAIAALVRGLAPVVEPLFPSGLPARGVTAADRAEARAPHIANAIHMLAPIFTRREFVTFIAGGLGLDVMVENASPPAVLVGATAAQQLSPPALMFLAARALVLLDLGYALVGRFSARDLSILAALVVRFFEPAVPAPLPDDRLKAYLDAMASLCPPELKDALAPIAPRAALELASFDVRAYPAALRKTANRAALLALGDAATALSTLVALDPRWAGGLPPAARPQAVAQNEELRDLYLFCLSDAWSDLRRQAGLG